MMKEKHIVFLYPSVNNEPNGGLKIVYEYANKLAADGHRVTIVYATRFADTRDSLRMRLVRVRFFLRQRLVRSRTGCAWYRLHPRVEERFVWEYTKGNVPHGDVLIATAVHTAPYAAALEGFRHKLYLIQGHEIFIRPDEVCRQSYALPLEKVVVSRWLQELVDRYSAQPSHLVPNGFDSRQYHLTVPVEQKERHRVSLLYHDNPRKGLKTAFAALKMVKERIPDLEADLFGVPEEPAGLPEWMHYTRNPSPERHLEINNRAAVYCGCSEFEGWGLTVGEAMMCGQAVVCTDNRGYLEMARDGDNALVAPIGDAAAVADGIIRLMEDDALRQRLARAGMESIRQFDVEESYRRFRDIVLQ